MKKNTIIILLLVFLVYEIIDNSIIIKESIISSFDLWKNNIFPFLFPFFVISDLLINTNIIEIINKYSNNIIYKLFKINSSSSFIFFMSILSGIPSNSKYIDTLIKANKLNVYEANKILLFSHFVSPLFILGFIGSIVGKKYSILILCIHYITNIILGLLFRSYHVNRKYYDFNINKTSNSFIKTITSSLQNSINTLLLILGVISFFSFLTTCINNSIENQFIKCIISGLLEITNGINNINLLNISLKLKSLFIIFIISFGGISSHIQVFSILEEYDIKYFPYFISRILHAIISSIILLLLI